jgi:hypothetical protein
MKKRAATPASRTFRMRTENSTHSDIRQLKRSTALKLSRELAKLSESQRPIVQKFVETMRTRHPGLVSR